MFQSRFGKTDKCFWWYLEIISADKGTQFTPMEFQDEYQTRGVNIALSAPENQEMNRQVKVTWIMLLTISQSLMLHEMILEAYIHFAFIYTTDHIFPVLTIKDLINEYGKTTTSCKLAIGIKTLIL